jgi:hypothetical protein
VLKLLFSVENSKFSSSATVPVLKVYGSIGGRMDFLITFYGYTYNGCITESLFKFIVGIYGGILTPLARFMSAI